MNPNVETPEQIRIAGLHALHEALGLVGMVRFLQQYETGHGDYSRDRHAWLDQWTLDDIRQELDAQRRPRDP
ncbi:MAG: hypothetical protein ACRDJE_09080 [Dehalococcoidia bacterium]